MGGKKVKLQMRITEEMPDTMDKHIAANPLYNAETTYLDALPDQDV